jgi:hypothetical protein
MFPDVAEPENETVILPVLSPEEIVAPDGSVHT